MSDTHDDSTIDLSKLGAEPVQDSDSLKDVSDASDEFQIQHLENGAVDGGGAGAAHEGHLRKEESLPDDDFFSKLEPASFTKTHGEVHLEPMQRPPSNMVSVKFDKFIQLVATHTYEDILKKDAGEDVIVSTNLLTDLANAHEEGSNVSKKLPIVLIAGIVLGVIITWLILRGGGTAEAFL
jgi:hypothetical protein